MSKDKIAWDWEEPTKDTMNTPSQLTLSRMEPIPVLDKGFVRLIDVFGSDQRIVESARVSYKSPSKGEEADKKLLFYLYSHLHTSPFEMCKITFNIKMPIFIARQYVRHRMQNLNEQSARYSQLPSDFYIPEKWRAQDIKNKQGSVIQKEWDKQLNDDESEWSQHQQFSLELQKHCEKAYALYEHYLSQGVAREMARMVLPLNIYTEFYATWDLKNLLHFFTLRDDPHAQWEHQQYGKAMKAFAQSHFPWVMEAYDRYKFTVRDMIEEPIRRAGLKTGVRDLVFEWESSDMTKEQLETKLDKLMTQFGLGEMN